MGGVEVAAPVECDGGHQSGRLWGPVSGAGVGGRQPPDVGHGGGGDVLVQCAFLGGEGESGAD